MMNPARHEDTSPNYVSEDRPKQYSSSDLKSFTSNFSESNCIGYGGFAEVYKAKFPCGELRAVKKLKNLNCEEDTFEAEVRTMGKTAHRNLVKFYGYCFEDNMKALVYEYMENGSLDKILYNHPHGNIEWAKLYDIVIDIANGLQYLHHGLVEQIIHHDIKAANVLLDKKFSAKIADFGLARIMDRDVSRVDLSRTRGTMGYNAPETWMHGSQVTSKCDVYSFGMMLFEVLGKKKNDRVENWFPILVWKQFEIGNLEKFLKNCGIAEKDIENADILCKVALHCAHEEPDKRPSMKDVVLMLEKNKLVNDPVYPFSVTKPASTSRVDLEVSPRNNTERERSDEMELDHTYHQNFTASPTNESVARSDGRVALPQLKSKKRKTRSANMLERSDKMELDRTYHQNIIASPMNESVARSDGRVALPQLKSKKRKTRSPNMLEEDLATLKPNKGMKFPTTYLVGKTTLKHRDLILQWIAKDEAVKIGVCGMGGVGKTTIFKHVHNRLLLEPNHFDKIIYVTVPKDGNITKLQDDLAKELDYELSSDDDEDRRSRLLLRAFEKRKRFVLFFDDVWTNISFDKVGIPEPTQENGCKLLLTSRMFDVLRGMGCQEKNTILVKHLPEDEALVLFMKHVEYVLTPEVRKIAEMVAKKCFGLPLAIITVGRAMKGNSNISEWRIALNDLNLKDPSRQTIEIKDNVHECLKFSFDRLENEMLRKCFLCCVLYPEDRPIVKRSLIDFWIMEGIVEGTDRQGEIDKAQYVFNKLKDRCLLETGYDVYDDEFDEISDGVKLHDLIREMALRLTDKCFMVKTSSLGLGNLQNAEEWNSDLERASFMDSFVLSLSITPICPKLSTLVVDGSFLNSLAHDFFLHMKCLKVLDLRCHLNVLK